MSGERRDWDDGSTLAHPILLTTRPTGAAFVVGVEDGPDRGAHVTVDAASPGAVLVGTSPVCALRLTDKTISRRHASLEIDGSALRISDLGSTNGTRVRGVRVEGAWIEGQGSIELGDTRLSVVPTNAAAGIAPPTIASFGRYVGASTEVRRLYPLFERLAASTVPVVIEGETGTGKEMLAEALHEMGPRAQGPFVVFDCTAVPSSLMESELFGHERGAFSGAVAARKGIFEQASGGTILIDEIGDLDLALQPKLLRALERSEIRRIGGDRAIRVDVRIVAATRRDLDAMVQRGTFRDDLFHRLAVARVELPALRKRKGDVEVLARHFWAEMGGAPQGPAPKQLQRWANHVWPGNTRELRNAVARVLALGSVSDPLPTSTVTPTDGDPIDALIRRGLPLGRAREILIEDFERRYVAWALGEHGGNVAKAAAAAGVARRYFQVLKTRFTR